MKYNTSIPHICPVYLYQEEIIVLPKSANIERMKQHLIPDDFIISEDLQVYETNDQLKNDRDLIFSFQPKRIIYAHSP